MSITLKISLIVLLLLSIVLIVRRLKHQNISIRYGVLWILLIFLLIISVAFSKVYFILSDFLGFEKPSNMIFLLGFFLLFYLIFILLTSISKLNDKVKNLVQEVSILKQKVANNEKKEK